MGCLVRVVLVGMAAAAALGGCGGGSSASSPAAVITSEADSILHLDQLRAAGFTGQNVRVGVISTGVEFLASYQKAGVLPQTLYVSQNTAGHLDEGSWMLELLHQHAPDALLGFCDGLDLDFTGCIEDLVNNFHADIIVDDLLFAGQFYPDASAAVVEHLESTHPRLVFVHLAGNEQRGGYWQGPFVTAQAALPAGTATVLDFGIASGGASDTSNSVTVPPGANLILLLNWNDAPHGAANHALSAYLLDGAGQELTHVSGASEPTLRLDYTNSEAAAKVVQLVVTLDRGAAAGLALQVTEGSPTCNIECQAFTHATRGLAGGTVGDFADALVVGATNAGAPHTLEDWSNYGPFRLDFTATADASSPDGYDYTRLATPLSVDKPDLVAPDCVTVPFSDGTTLANNMFCGTSAAVPAIAGAAALLESAGFDRLAVLKSLRGTAVPLAAAAWTRDTALVWPMPPPPGTRAGTERRCRNGRASATCPGWTAAAATPPAGTARPSRHRTRRSTEHQRSSRRACDSRCAWPAARGRRARTN
jgi:hypothetical protein